MSQSSIIWDKLISCKNEIINIFNENGTEYDEPGLAHFNNDLWINRVWQNENVRRAHIDVVDARDTKGLWPPTFSDVDASFDPWQFVAWCSNKLKGITMTKVKVADHSAVFIHATATEDLI